MNIAEHLTDDFKAELHSIAHETGFKGLMKGIESMKGRLLEKAVLDCEKNSEKSICYLQQAKILDSILVLKEL